MVLAARALTIGALFQIGLFWAASARDWQLLAAGAAMVPSALIFASLTGEAFMRVARGVPPNYVVAATAVCGVIVYAVAFWHVVRTSLTKHASAAEAR